MLTRCSAGMVIVSSRAFLENNGKDTLLGKMAQYWVSRCGREKAWVDWRAVVENKVNLPGAPAKHAATKDIVSLFGLVHTVNKLAPNSKENGRKARRVGTVLRKELEKTV